MKHLCRLYGRGWVQSPEPRVLLGLRVTWATGEGGERLSALCGPHTACCGGLSPQVPRVCTPCRPCDPVRSLQGPCSLLGLRCPELAGPGVQA